MACHEEVESTIMVNVAQGHAVGKLAAGRDIDAQRELDDPRCARVAEQGHRVVAKVSGHHIEPAVAIYVPDRHVVRHRTRHKVHWRGEC
jgi:hypothetical protein